MNEAGLRETEALAVQEGASLQVRTVDVSNRRAVQALVQEASGESGWMYW
ncbi:hypothetical protein ACFSC4_20415 [Deinococcus malanensis]